MRHKKRISEEYILLKGLNGELKSNSWNELALKYIIPENLLIKYFDKFDLNELIKNQTLSYEFIKNKILTLHNVSSCYDYLIYYQDLSEEILLDIYNNTSNNNLKIEMLEKFKMSDECFLELMYYITPSNIGSILKNCKYNVETVYALMQYKPNLLSYILSYYKFTENELDKLIKDFKFGSYEFNTIFNHQQVSEDFIIKYQKKISDYDLYLICINQKLSNDFIERNFHNFDSSCRQAIKKYQNYTGKFNIIYNPDNLI